MIKENKYSVTMGDDFYTQLTLLRETTMSSYQEKKNSRAITKVTDFTGEILISILLSKVLQLCQQQKIFLLFRMT